VWRRTFTTTFGFAWGAVPAAWAGNPLPPELGGGAPAAVDPAAGDCAPSAAMIDKNADELRPAARIRLAAAG
jgi:hypothetical protein